MTKNIIKEIEDEVVADEEELTIQDEMLQGIGRDFASDLLQNATSSGGQDETANQIDILRYAAIHILGTICFYEADPEGGTERIESRVFTVVQNVKEEIEEEVTFLISKFKDGETVLTGAGDETH